ncbi:hypothetical protein Lal_00026674 [Lupinus albus]|nr:hypothetical protein Lal_00026674 [Lupinus albus]
MTWIASSSSIFLACGIFISRVIDYLEIDTSDLEVIVTNSCEHLISDNLIHKTGICKYGDILLYQEDHVKMAQLFQSYAIRPKDRGRTAKHESTVKT